MGDFQKWCVCVAPHGAVLGTRKTETFNKTSTCIVRCAQGVKKGVKKRGKIMLYGESWELRCAREEAIDREITRLIRVLREEVPGFIIDATDDEIEYHLDGMEVF